jgi:hypothetical protein
MIAGLVFGLLMLIGVWLGWPSHVSAQSPPPMGTSFGFSTNPNIPCQPPAAGQLNACFTAPTTANPTGLLLSNNGTPYASLGGGTAVGPKGDAATVTVGNTSTGATGTLASVTNSGTSNAAVLNFTIPQGPSGPAGTMPTTFICDISIAVGGKATLSNCK